MNRDELIATVPVQLHNGTPYFIRLADVPEPWRNQFVRALTDKNRPRPYLEGEVDLQIAYAYDWQSWAHHCWYDKEGPIGLDAPAKLAKISRNSADEFIAELDDGRVLIHANEEALANQLLARGFNSAEVLVLSFWESSRALSSEQKDRFMHSMHCQFQNML